jgi:hypothetical protein
VGGRPLNYALDGLNLPDAVASDLSDSLALLDRAGFVAERCTFAPESFGNYVVIFRRGDRTIDVTRDRGQYLIGGLDRRTLESLGLWRALESKDQLAAGLRAILAGPV